MKVSVSVETMKCSNGVFYYTTIRNDEGKSITPYFSQIVGRANAEAINYARVLGVEPTLVTITDDIRCPHCEGLGIDLESRFSTKLEANPCFECDGNPLPIN